MRMRIAGLGAALAVLAAGPAFAQEKDWSDAGGYVGGNLGLASVQDNEWSSPGIAPNVKVETSTDPGIFLAGVLGYRFGGGFRLDGELAIRANGLDEFRATNQTTGVTSSAPFNGSVSSVGLMGNVYYDIAVKGQVFPYVGAGVGFANVKVTDDDAGVSEDDSVLAYQARLGLGIKLAPSMLFTLGYGYFATQDIEIETVFGPTKIDYRTHNIEVGVRVGF